MNENSLVLTAQSTTYQSYRVLSLEDGLSDSHPLLLVLLQLFLPRFLTGLVRRVHVPPTFSGFYGTLRTHDSAKNR